MNGANERPGPADPDGTAKAKVEIDVAKGEVCFKFDWKNIASPTMGHIHQGPAGVAGPIVVHLLDNFSLDRLEADDDIKGCVNADPGLLGDIVAHPDQYYVNLHNVRFPAGADSGPARGAPSEFAANVGIGPARQPDLPACGPDEILGNRTPPLATSKSSIGAQLVRAESRGFAMSRALVRRARLSLGVVAAGITGALLAVGPGGRVRRLGR